MHLRTLGGLTFEGTDFGRPKPLLLLAYLAVEGPQDRRHMAELFWRGAKDPMASLRVALTRLRGVARDALREDEHRIATDVDCDAPTLLTELEQGESDIVDLYGGAFLDGFYLRDLGGELEEWIYGTREFLAERVRMALLARANSLSASGKTPQAIEVAERALDVAGAGPADPEQLEAIFRILHTGDSRRTHAVARELADYGVELPAKSREEERPLPDALPTEIPHNLFQPTTSFVGREEELRAIAELLSSGRERLVTLLGTAGVGKTRLSIQAAHEVLGSDLYPDGVYWVPLDDVTIAEGIAYRIAETVGFTPQGSDPVIAQVGRFLGDKRLLLVLDNYEQLVEVALAPVDLVVSCPHLTILVTSRERLNVGEECVVFVEGLTYPHDPAISAARALDHDAVRLFTLRAQRSDPGFRLDDATLPGVLRICGLVEGAPLGLELTAAWTRALSVDDIAAELRAGLDGLTALSRDVPEKHRSLAAAFERSWTLLSLRERDVLKRLSVFRGGFRREAASEVVGATLPLLAGLVDKSLLRMAPNGRYDRHPLLYQFSYEKLAQDPDELAEYRVKHGEYFRGNALEHYDRVETELSPGVLERAREELPNILAAWDTYLELRDADSVAELADFHGYISELWGLSRQGEVLMERALGVFTGDDPHSRLARGRVQGFLVMTYWRLGRFEDGVRLGERALAILAEFSSADNRRASWWAAQGRGICLLQLGRFEDALTSFRQSYDVGIAGLRDGGSNFATKRMDGLAGISAAVLGICNALMGDFEQARRWAEEAYLRAHRSIPRAAGYATGALTQVALEEGSFAEAERIAREGLEHVERVGHDVQVVPMRSYLGRALFYQGRYREACEVLELALERAEQIGDRSHGTPSRAVLGRALQGLGRSDEALPHLLRAASDAHETSAVPYALDTALLGLAEVAETRGRRDVAGRIAARLADLEAAQPIVRREAREMLERLPATDLEADAGWEAFLREVVGALR